MTSSVLPALTDALVALFETADGLEGVHIAEGEREDIKAAEWIVVGTGEAEREFASLGNQPTPLDEIFTVACDAAVVQAGAKSWTATKTRAYQLLEAAENAIRADVTLNDVARIFWLRIAKVSHRFEPVDKGRACAVRFVIEGKTRI